MISPYHAPIPIQPDENCAGLGNFNEKSEICAGHKDGAHDTCAGDSGGPLMCPVNNNKTSNEHSDCEWLLTGIVKGGKDSNCGQTFGFYTDIRYYYDWIKKIIKAENPEITTTTATQKNTECSINIESMNCMAIKFDNNLFIEEAKFKYDDSKQKNRYGTQYLSIKGKGKAFRTLTKIKAVLRETRKLVTCLSVIFGKI